jgi:hypothetical protein
MLRQDRRRLLGSPLRNNLQRLDNPQRLGSRRQQASPERRGQ